MSLKRKVAEGAAEGAAVEVSKAAVCWAFALDFSWVAGVVTFAKHAVIEPVATYPLAFFAVFMFGGLTGFTVGMIVRYISLKKRIDRKNEVARLESEVSRLKKKVESEEAEVRRKFESLNLGQSDLVSLTHGERNGFKLSASSDKFHLAKRREDVFEVQNWFADPVTISLTPEWNLLMNKYSDMFYEIWGPRKSDAYVPRSLTK